MFEVSIVIPVYNAANFVTQAVDSALAQPETAEVLLIEDGSPDESLAVCQALVEKNDKVRLLQHPGGLNRGEAASRNLGMQHAQYDYIAFLDADDYYLPGRFSATRKIFESDPMCDGVYEAMGGQFENESAKRRWQDASLANAEMTTMTEIVPPEKLFTRLVEGGVGRFSICGLAIKKAALRDVGYMNEALRLHTDSDFIWRLAAIKKLLPGELDQPVVIRRVHDSNVISAPRTEIEVYKDLMKVRWSTYDWLDKMGLKEKKQIVFKVILYYATHFKPLPCKWMSNLPTFSGQPSFLGKLIRLSLFPFVYPKVILIGQYWKATLSIFFLAAKRNINRLRSLLKRDYGKAD